MHPIESAMRLSLYVSDEVASAVRRQADDAGLSVSKYLAGLVRRELGAGWPERFFEEVVGGLAGLSARTSATGNARLPGLAGRSVAVPASARSTLYALHLAS